jgi:hypothetical protein
VSANIVAPKTKAYIGGCGGKPWLIRQRFPVNNYIAAKTYLVALITQAAIPVKYQRPFALALHIAKVHVV